jgi:segregation and condensation protein A
MTDTAENFDEFESTALANDDETLLITVDGFEGPLDLLLTLARNQKVDIAKISILKLAEQYLEFVEGAKKLNLELAADYLVMAAWLAYLKSRLILPQEKDSDGEPTADEMATRLRWRLQRLDAMRAASTRLMGRERLDRDVFGRGDPEAVNVIKLRTYKDTLYDLLTAYATDRVRKLGGKTYRPEMAPVLAIEEARERLERMLCRISDWSAL